MDLVADMLCAELDRHHAATVNVTRIQPGFARRLSRGPAEPGSKIRFNADRFLNRFVDYPRALRRLDGNFDLFHIIDHSYAHLVHELSQARTVVTCHDLDAFGCLLKAGGERRSILFRTMARRILSGLRTAASVTCDSVATRDALAANALVAPEKLTVIPNGVHPACSPNADEAVDRTVARLLGAASPEAPEILHVGSVIPRKRIDVLLRVFADARRGFPSLRLLKAGGALTDEQARLAGELDIANAIVTMPFLAPPMLAALYRRAALVLVPSEAEGFGLPAVEAMACGTPVLLSDIAALREVGAEAAVYCPVADVPAWSESMVAMLRERVEQPARWAERRTAAIRHASRFSWTGYADRTAALYKEIAQ